MADANGRISSLKTVGAFFKKGACSETLFYVLNRHYGHPMPVEEHASALLAGGLMMHGYQCGQAWGAALAAGAEACRRYGVGTDACARALGASQRTAAAFRAQTGHLDCFDITELNEESSKSILRILAFTMRKGGPVLCLRMAARYAPVARREIDAALADPRVDAAPAPVSCAALVAEKMGASPAQSVMAAGLAGGIGLAGGACGALGAAIWVNGIKNAGHADGKRSLKSPEATRLIDRFLACTKYEFECSRIVGRTFDGVSDHARHVCNGGCARIIDTLAAPDDAARPDAGGPAGRTS